MRGPRIALVGERDAAKKAHQGIEMSAALYRRDVDPNLDYYWVHTASITQESIQDLFRDATAIWCTPGSPYVSISGALLAIWHARTEMKAFLGTCGGFQHGLIEFSQNVLLRRAEHRELDPEAKDPLIEKLSCSLIGTMGRVIATPPLGQFADILGANESVEEFNCNYGINSNLTAGFYGSDLEFAAHDEMDQVRAFRLRQHPFFIGTLFQPERRALAGSLHPIVRAFFHAASGWSNEIRS